eukprot:7390234-Prymnesium_polylepis.1
MILSIVQRQLAHTAAPCRSGGGRRHQGEWYWPWGHQGSHVRAASDHHPRPDRRRRATRVRVRV